MQEPGTQQGDTKHPNRNLAAFMRERRLFLLLIPCLTTLLAVHCSSHEWLQSVDRFALDSYFRVRGSFPPPQVAEQFPHTRDIVLIESRNPVPRQLQARVLEKLRLAKVVAFDLMFVDNEAELRAVEKEQGWYADEIQRWRADDAVLAKAIAEHGNVVLGTWAEEVATRTAPRLTDKAVIAPQLQRQYTWQRPQDDLWRSARYRAHLSVEPEGGVVRRVHLLRETTLDDKAVPSLGLAAAAAALDVSPTWNSQAAQALGYMQLGERQIPVDTQGRIFIDYVGGRESFTYVSNRIDYSEVLNFYEAEDFRGKIVLIGQSSLKSKDIARTPFGETSGMQVHANIIATLLDERGPPVQLPFWETTLLTLGSSMLLASLITWRVPLWSNLLFALLLVGGLILIGCWFFVERREILQIGPALLAIALTYNIIALYEYQRTRQMLSKLVGRDMLRRVLGVFSPLELGGQVEDACALFCDLRGFSKLAAILPPMVTSRVLNEYTNVLVQVARAHGGRPISFQGDGVFVLFEEDLAGRHFDLQAVRAAAAFQCCFEELQARWEHEGVAHLEIGIGIASGPMMIGLVGSDDHMKPDAVGDAVNIAARLQGLSGEIGHQILISQSTQEHIREAIPTLFCGSHVIRGRDEPLEVYAVIDVPLEPVTKYRNGDRWKRSFQAPYERLQELTHLNIDFAHSSEKLANNKSKKEKTPSSKL